MPKESPPGGVQGEYLGMDDYGDEDEVDDCIITLSLCLLSVVLICCCAAQVHPELVDG